MKYKPVNADAAAAADDDDFWTRLSEMVKAEYLAYLCMDINLSCIC